LTSRTDVSMNRIEASASRAPASQASLRSAGTMLAVTVTMLNRWPRVVARAMDTPAGPVTSMFEISRSPSSPGSPKQPTIAASYPSSSSCRTSLAVGGIDRYSSYIDSMEAGPESTGNTRTSVPALAHEASFCSLRVTSAAPRAVKWMGPGMT
jgi:hypothetical protein